MGKTLVLAEKPSVGRDLARVLGCRQKANGYIEGPQHIVTWALGHLVELAQPEAYDKRYQTWSMETLPMLPEHMQLEVIPSTAKQYGVVKKLLHDKRVSALVIATDAGREGELVARWILDKAGYRGPIKRLWISSQTDKAIQQGFAHLRDGRDYVNLYHSAQARAEADWLVGLNVTRALTCKYNAQLSAGRVQTPTLALLAARENEIRQFVPKPYFTVRADLGKLFATWQDAHGQTQLFDRQKAQDIAQRIEGHTFTVTDVKTASKSVPVPMLYDLTELQRDANRQYGYSAKQTLNIMQRLYEQHKALTYPRTDSRYLTEDIVPTLRDRLEAVRIGNFRPIVSEIVRGRKTIAKACINNGKVSDHHAIIPTEEAVDLSALSTEELRIYSLVVQRFLTCFYPPYTYLQIKAELECGGERFRASGRKVEQLGWKQVGQAHDEEEEAALEEEQTLPELKRGAAFRCANVQLKEGKTKPPARYTEATLLSAMENPSRFIADKSMKEYIGGGLGTPATRADIIEKLFSSFYMEKRGKELVPTSKGMQLVSLVPQDLKEPLLTAKWEQQLDGISKGKTKKETFIQDMRRYAKTLVATVASSTNTYVHDNLSRTPCPQCGKMMLKVNGKRGKMLVCQDRDCGYRQNVSFQSNVRCPNCHKRMEIYGAEDKRTYVCACGFREKVDRFHEKNKASMGGASKQFVKQYLKQQNQQQQEVSAFELALQKAMEEQKKS